MLTEVIGVSLRERAMFIDYTMWERTTLLTGCEGPGVRTEKAMDSGLGSHSSCQSSPSPLTFRDSRCHYPIAHHLKVFP
jgi:hypothetical protein